MSPIQFVKSMRLNNAAKRIAQGVNVSVAAMDVGYVSSSQFSRDFKRAYGQSPKQWEKAHKSKSNLQ
ncbi:helix-turn-helix domain-containing protein [Alteromonas gracilis]|uniref:helix-turn-helix domain-containing protein n=1 Tax=Alteromonas gracilis TaxID=1479524 RepID=UPI0030CBE75E